MLTRRTLLIKLMSELSELTFDRSASANRWLSLALALKAGPITVEHIVIRLARLGVPIEVAEDFVLPIRDIQNSLKDLK